MVVADEIKEWWTQALLNQTRSAHPIFGNNVDVKVDGDVLTLTGTVDSVDQIEEFEREAHGLGHIHTVINRLNLAPGLDNRYHKQTVIAIFDTVDAAKVACAAVSNAKIHEGSNCRILERGPESEEYLHTRAEAAQIGASGVQHFLDALDEGHALLVDCVPEDDALRMISTLEGSDARSIETLPPEPDTLE